MATKKPPAPLGYLPARKTDPETSKQAARELMADEDRTRTLQLRALRYVAENPEKTAKELTVIASDDESGTIRRRLSELERKGWIKVIGKRVCTVTGRMAQIYVTAEIAPPPAEPKVVLKSRRLFGH